MVDMSQRQKTLYRALRQRVSISELLAQASNLNDSAGTKHLMNLVMQFRKVCSHPDLFERADVVSPFFFGTFSQSGRTTKEGDNMYCPASGRNAIAPTLPRLVWEDKVDRPKEESNAGDKRWILNNMMSIWNPDWVVKRLKEEQQRDDGYGFLRFLDQSPAKVAKAAKGHPLVQLVSGAEDSEDLQNDGAYEG
jgi:DNA helicase INO80